MHRDAAARAPRNPLLIWDLYLGACAIITPVVAVLLGDTLVERIGAAAALVGMYGWYRLCGRGHLARQMGSAPLVLPIGTLAIFAAGLAFEPAIPLGWGIVFPLLFLGSRRRTAVVCAAIAAMLPPVTLAIRGGLGEPFLVPYSILGVAAGGAAILLGAWIGRISELSDQRARLIEQLESSQGEVRRLSREAGMATERARLAGEIHDTLAQGFTSIVTLVQAAESKIEADPAAARRHLALAAETARENLAEARAMVASLTPTPLASGTLGEAIRRRAEQVGHETSATVAVRVDDVDGLPTAVEVVLLRTAQEALANVAKHAGARHVAVEFGETPDFVRLTIDDDGAGFDPDAAHTGFGLAGMHKRAEAVGAALRVESRPGAGTNVTLEVPS